MYKITTNGKCVSIREDNEPNEPGHKTAVSCLSYSVAMAIAALCEFSEVLTVDAIQLAYQDSL